jgi:hypothetical protein
MDADFMSRCLLVVLVVATVCAGCRKPEALRQEPPKRVETQAPEPEPEKKPVVDTELDGVDIMDCSFSVVQIGDVRPAGLATFELMLQDSLEAPGKVFAWLGPKLKREATFAGIAKPIDKRGRFKVELQVGAELPAPRLWLALADENNKLKKGWTRVRYEIVEPLPGIKLDVQGWEETQPETAMLKLVSALTQSEDGETERIAFQSPVAGDLIVSVQVQRGNFPAQAVTAAHRKKSPEELETWSMAVNEAVRTALADAGAEVGDYDGVKIGLIAGRLAHSTDLSYTVGEETRRAHAITISFHDWQAALLITYPRNPAWYTSNEAKRLLASFRAERPEQ